MPRKSRNTRQKELIRLAIDHTTDFFSAEDLQKKLKNISIATIYRFLKKMRKDKEIYSYQGNSRLLYSKDRISHCHFICQETGKVIHFDVDSLDFLKDKIPGTITSFQIEVRGKCNRCQKLPSSTHEYQCSRIKPAD